MTSTRYTSPLLTATSLFGLGGGPQQTYSPTQGSIFLFLGSSCQTPLSDTATPLIIGDCLNAPVTGILGAKIGSKPQCDNFGTALLTVWNQPDCKSSTTSTAGNTGVVNSCLTINQGDQIGSMSFQCFGHGTASAQPVSTVPGGGMYSGSGSTSLRRWNAMLLLLQVLGFGVIWV